MVLLEEQESQESLEHREIGANLGFLDPKESLVSEVYLVMLQQLLDLQVKMENQVKTAQMVYRDYLVSLDKREILEMKDLLEEMDATDKTANEGPKETLDNLGLLVTLVVKAEMV